MFASGQSGRVTTGLLRRRNQCTHARGRTPKDMRQVRSGVLSDAGQKVGCGLLGLKKDNFPDGKNHIKTSNHGGGTQMGLPQVAI